MVYKNYIFLFIVYILFSMQIPNVWSIKTTLYSHDDGKYQPVHDLYVIYTHTCVNLKYILNL